MSTSDQNLDFQLDELEEVGCEKLYQEEISGAADSRPELDRCLEELRGSDILVTWCLDRSAAC